MIRVYYSSAASMTICGHSGALEFSDPCIRSAWSSLLPAAFVVLLCVTSLPLPTPLRKITKVIKSPFTSFLTLPEAEAYDEGKVPTGELTGKPSASLWLTLALSWTALLETVAWVGIGCFKLSGGDGSIWEAWQAIILAFSWLYASAKPVVSPSATPPFDLVALYIVQLGVGILMLGGIVFDHNIYGVPLPGTAVIVARSVNLAAVVGLLLLLFNMPLAIPSERVDVDQIVSRTS